MLNFKESALLTFRDRIINRNDNVANGFSESTEKDGITVKNYNDHSRPIKNDNRTKMSYNIEDVAGVGSCQTHNNSISQRTSLTRNTIDAVNKRIPSEKSEKAIHRVTQQQLQPERPDWWDVVNRINHLEEFLGYPVGLLDLQKFQKEEIDIVREFLPRLKETMEDYSESEPYHLSLIAEKAKGIAMNAGRGLM
jgi:hypothetical protein